MRKRTRKKALKRLIRRILCESFFFALLLLAGGVAGFALIYFFRVPSGEDLFEKTLPETSIIYDRTGTVVLYEIHGEEDRKVIAHEDIPDAVRKATIATEDDSFYRHPGFDVFSLVRAFGKNLESGRIVQGGSTITQQVARIFYLDNRKTIARKLNEIVLAFKIERLYSKDQILDLYLNSIPYGSNAYGIQAAAETFFGKSAKDLSVDEAAFLAALPKATTYYSPYRGNSIELIARQRGIIRRMGELGLISDTEVRNALSVETFGKLLPEQNSIRAPHFVFFVLEELRKEYGTELLERGGLRVVTTVDMRLQEMAEENVRQGALRNASYRSENAAAVVMDPNTGEILAMVGSKGFFDEDIDGEVNVAIRPRQPGSSFKPFVYARAFEEGFEPETHVLDEPVNFGPDGGGRDYIPQNYDGKSHGMLTLRQALSMSLNIPAVQVLKVVGVSDAIDLAERLGITTLTDRNRYGLSLVLGGADVRLLDMVSAYSVFATDGVRHDIVPVRRISKKNGVTIFSAKTDSGKQVLDAVVARKIQSILSDNAARTPIFGARSPLAFPGSTVAAKTGTTQGFRDAWTVGFTPSIAVGVWAGNNDNRPMRSGADGVFVAAPIWRSIIVSAMQMYPSGPFQPYIAKSPPDSRLISGGVPGTYSPNDEKTEKKDKKKKKKK